MSTGGLSKARLGRMHDVMAGYVERTRRTRSDMASPPTAPGAKPEASARRHASRTGATSSM